MSLRPSQPLSLVPWVLVLNALLAGATAIRVVQLRDAWRLYQVTHQVQATLPCRTARP